jgi:hypothetical protein
VAYWSGYGLPAMLLRHSCDIILLQYVLMFVPPDGQTHLARAVDQSARFGCVLVLEAYRAKNQHYQLRMLHDFVDMLNGFSGSDGRWEYCMTEGNDHLALQLRATNATD